MFNVKAYGNVPTAYNNFLTTGTFSSAIADKLVSSDYESQHYHTLCFIANSDNNLFKFWLRVRRVHIHLVFFHSTVPL